MHEKTVYLTREGKERFTAELHELTTVRRHEVEERIRRAKEFADTTDNAEYDLAKSDQAFVEGRIQELEHMLASAQLIEEPPSADFVRLGCRVTVRTSDGEEETYHLVGSQEANPRRGLISNESPLGRALIGKRVGEETTVVAPGGSFTVEVLSIASH
jgi:transcription elongation factor GreA